MTQNYLYQNLPSNQINHENSYLNFTNTSSDIINYRQLPEEYDVFSNVRNEIFKINDESQKKLINFFCDSLQRNLYKNLDLDGITTVLPKFSIEKDSDDAYIFNLIKNNYRIFINFEKEITKSFYGIILQQLSDDYISTTGKIKKNNFTNLITKLSQIILSN